MKLPVLRRMSFGSLRQWHWVSGAVCLIGMLLFAATGITLNNAGQIEGRPTVTTLETALPAPLLVMLQGGAEQEAPLPEALLDWLRSAHGLHIPARVAEWKADEVYLDLARPGSDAWLSVNTETGDLVYERMDRGWIAYLNDLHKGRDTGLAWSWFIDLFAAACIIFSVTGLLLLRRQATLRPTTWPLVGLGLALPLLLIILFVR